MIYNYYIRVNKIFYFIDLKQTGCDMGELSKLQNGSDVRGIAVYGVNGENVNLTMIEARKISAAFAAWLKRKRKKKEISVAIGKDTRISAEELMEGSIEGLNHENALVYNIGFASTPCMFSCIIDEELKCDGSIMLTADNQPYNKNGMKFFTKDGYISGEDMKEILDMAEKIDTNSLNIKARKIDFLSKYSNSMLEMIRKKTGEEKPFDNSKIIIDAGNGVGGFFANRVLLPLGADTFGSLYMDKNGMFPNHVPNPELESVIGGFKEAVLNKKAELGIIFDTDVDMAAIVDGNGVPINRNRLVALMSAIALEEYPGTTIVTDSVTSNGLKEFIEKKGGKHQRYRRGYKNVIDEAKRLNENGVCCALAIETSGHCAFRDNHFLDDGAYMAARILIKYAELKKQGKNISDVIRDLREPVESEEIRIEIKSDDYKQYGGKILEDFQTYILGFNGINPVQPNYDGVRAVFDDKNGNGWCMIRTSLNDPTLPVNIESDEKGGAVKIKQFVFDFLKKYRLLAL